jgi:hypothetical protein
MLGTLRSLLMGACATLLPSLALAQSTEGVASEETRRTAATEPQLETAEHSWSPLSLGPVQLSMFVDAYAGWQSAGKGTLATLSEHRAFSGQSSTLRAENGLSLAFVGFDARYDTGTLGAVVNLRFGQAATIFHNANDSIFGVQYLTQAYALYRPFPELELDLGMFVSPFGFEALESWKNPNYTLSALYVYGQPNWHMGFRATWQIAEDLSVMALVVNGTNNISETQQNDGLEQMPTVGGSINYDVTPALLFALGGLLAADRKRNDDDGVDGFADFVGVLELGALRTALNVDYIFTRDGAPSGANRHFLGGSLTAGYRFNDFVAVAARAEYLRDNARYDGQDLWRLVTGTLTLDVEPVPHHGELVLRWENRWEKSNQRIFGRDARGTADPADDTYGRTWFETVLGVVVTTSP